MKFSINRLCYAIDQVENDAAMPQKAADLGFTNFENRYYCPLISRSLLGGWVLMASARAAINLFWSFPELSCISSSVQKIHPHDLSKIRRQRWYENRCDLHEVALDVRINRPYNTNHHLWNLSRIYM